MSAITKEFTKEQLIAAAVGRIEMAEETLANDLVPLARHTFEIDLELARIALASLEAEPVAWIVHARTGDQLTTDGNYVANAEGILGLHSTPLYTAPPAQVCVDEIAGQAGIDPDIADAYMQGVNDANQRKLADIIPSAIPEGLTGQIVYLCAFDNMPRHELANRIWNACRDAIVHTELSVRSDCPWCDGEGYVEIDHGFEMGVEQKECRHCRAAMLQGSDGNSPVIPDGWVMVPVEPTEEMCDVGHVGIDVLTGVTDENEYYSIDGEDAAKVYRAMIAAAPQQEVNNDQ